VSPKLTVGLPVFNGDRHLREAIESILGQSFGDFRLLVSDNASTDGTQDIARGYAALDPRVRYHRNDANIGLAANFNLAFRMSDTPYFRWATADDVSLPDFLRRCVECLERESDVVLAYTKTRFIDADGNALDRQDRGLDLPSEDPAERFRRILEAGSWVNAILGVIRSDALAKSALLPSYSSGDFGLLGELCLLGKFREIPECLFLRRLHDRSSSQHVQEVGWMELYWKGRAGPVSPPLWNRCRHHFKTIVRSTLPVRTKLSLAGHLLRTMSWRRDRLRRELIQALASRFPRLGGSPKQLS
jgi:glycosyltransferase involved in cell wall biosynthesis